MLKLKDKQYRRDYTGEKIVVSRTVEKNNWLSETEEVPNRVTNRQISNRAVVFGNS